MKFSREEKTPWGRRSCSKQTSWKGTTIQNSCRQIFPGVRERSQAGHYLTGSWFYSPFSKFSTEMWKTLIKLFYLPDFDWVLIQPSPLRQLASTWWDIFLGCFLLCLRYGESCVSPSQNSCSYFCFWLCISPGKGWRNEKHFWPLYFSPPITLLLTALRLK